MYRAAGFMGIFESESDELDAINRFKMRDTGPISRRGMDQTLIRRIDELICHGKFFGNYEVRYLK